MGIDRSVLLAVGVPFDEVFRTMEITKQIPIFDRYTGEPDGFEEDTIFSYFLDDLEIEDPLEFLEEHELTWFEFPDETKIVGLDVYCLDENEIVSWDTLGEWTAVILDTMTSVIDKLAILNRSIKPKIYLTMYIT